MSHFQRQKKTPTLNNLTAQQHNGPLLLHYSSTLLSIYQVIPKPVHHAVVQKCIFHLCDGPHLSTCLAAEEFKDCERSAPTCVTYCSDSQHVNLYGYST